jgi:hypothetical protein
MTKSREIKEIIEGFKLGKLGAGHKFKSVPEPEEFGEIEKFGSVEPDDDIEMTFGAWVKGYWWTESNGYNFLLACLRQTNKTYEFTIWGGKHLDVPKFVRNDGDLPDDAPFMLVSHYTGNPEHRFPEILGALVEDKSLGRAYIQDHLGSWKLDETGSSFQTYLKSRL